MFVEYAADARIKLQANLCMCDHKIVVGVFETENVLLPLWYKIDGLLNIRDLVKKIFFCSRW
jgi:hypothetical protein